MISSYKLMFMTTLATGTVISVSSSTWLGVWIGLEINLLSMIPLMNHAKNQLNTEASIKYFITQAMASTLILLSIILTDTSPVWMNYSDTIMASAVLTKMGAAPFHFWFPEVMEGLSWVNSMIMLTWQKIAPMVIFMYTKVSTSFILMIIMSSMVISGFMGINQTSLRKILVFSSINHIGWMLSTTLVMETIWLYYFAIYAVISVAMIMIFKEINVFHLNQLVNNTSMAPQTKTLILLNFLSLGGLPPFLGFFPKWLTIQLLIESKFLVTTTLMTLLTLVPLYFYMRVAASSILISSGKVLSQPMSKITAKTAMTVNLMSIASLVIATILFNFS